MAIKLELSVKRALLEARTPRWRQFETQTGYKNQLGVQSPVLEYYHSNITQPETYNSENDLRIWLFFERQMSILNLMLLFRNFKTDWRPVMPETSFETFYVCAKKISRNDHKTKVVTLEKGTTAISVHRDPKFTNTQAFLLFLHCLSYQEVPF